MDLINMTKEQLIELICDLQEELDNKKLKEKELIKHCSYCYKDIIEDQTDLIIRCKPDSTITFVNEALCRYFGTSRDKLIGTKSMAYIKNVDKKSELLKCIFSANPNNPVWTNEYCFEIPGGNRWMLWNNRALFNSEGQLTEVQSVGRDITKYNITVEELRKSEEKYRLLFETMQHGVIIYGKNEGEVISANPAAVNILGLSLELMQGCTSSDLCWRAADEYGNPIETHPAMIALNYGTEVSGVIMKIFNQAKNQFRWLDVNAIPMFKDGEDRPYQVYITFKDITERMVALDALQESEARYQALLNSSYDGVSIIELTKDNMPGKYIEVNDVICKRIGYKREELLELSPIDIIDKGTLADTIKKAGKLLSGEQVLFSTVLLTKSGNKVPFEMSINLFRYKGQQTLMCISRDITERVQYQDSLKAAHQKLLDIIEFLPDATFVIDSDKRVIAWNKASEEMTGVSKEYILNKGWNDYSIPFYSFKRPMLIDLIAADNLNAEKPYEYIKKRGDTLLAEAYLQNIFGGKGAFVWAAATPFFDSSGNMIGAIETIRDVSDFKKIQMKMNYRLAVEEALANVSSLLISQKNVDLNNVLRVIGEVVSVNKAYIFQFRDNGRKMDNTYEWCKSSTEAQINNLQNLDTAVFTWFMRSIKQGKNIIIKDVIGLPAEAAAEKEIFQQHNILSLIAVPIISNAGSMIGCIGFCDTESSREWSAEDIKIIRVVAGMVGIHLEQQQAKIALQQSEQKLRNIVNHATNLFYTRNVDNVVTYMSQQSRMYLDCEPEEALVKWDELLTSDPINTLGMIKTHCAIDTGQRQPAYLLELIGKERRKIWVEVNETPVVENGKTVQIVGSLTDITKRKSAEDKLKESYRRLKRSFEDIVNALSLTVEIRDPYTAGHQHRVSHLACAIAKEMGLAREQIFGIRIAGILHDIGKLYIPSEILCKPGKINQMEMNLVRSHPQVGSDILKKIDFDYPIADLVLQHHERVNGTGYPFGLRGDEIRIEAKILAVADVVEAISAHRPYRAALGLKEAFEEILQNRGILYDANIVDACLKIFKQNIFGF